MTPKRKSPAALEKECAAFNAKYPVGTKVGVRLDFTEELTLTTTRSTAQVLSGHSSVIWLDGISGCYLLDRVMPIAAEVAA